MSIKKIAIILAGGVGKRMGNLKLPKQFLELYNTPIIILTLKRVLESKLFDSIYIVMNPNWIGYMNELVDNYHLSSYPIEVISGGDERIDSIENALNYYNSRSSSDDDIVVILDAVRPFVSDDILRNAIKYTEEYGATVAVSPVKDTMIRSENGIAIEIPDRSKMYHGQAPDSFKFKIIYDAIKSLSEEERFIITGTAQICQRNGITVHTFLGDEKNIKITTTLDLFIAQSIYKEVFNQ